MQAQYSNLVPSKINNLINAGTLILKSFQRQEKVSVYQLKTIMTEACGGSDADGYWIWKDAYEAVEIGLIKYLISYQRQHDRVSLEDLIALEKLYTVHNKRSDKSEKLQQFSTPVTLAYLATQAAQVKENDVVLEPSAGNGLLAVYAAMDCKQVINEGILSDIQLETIIRAGEAHSKLLDKWVKIDENDKVLHFPYAEPNSHQERQGRLKRNSKGKSSGISRTEDSTSATQCQNYVRQRHRCQQNSKSSLWRKIRSMGNSKQCF